jgi:hypothetical protein
VVNYSDDQSSLKTHEERQGGGPQQCSYLVVTESRQLVDDGVVRVRDVEQCQGERNHALHRQLAIVQQVVERTHAHLYGYCD